MARTSAAVGIVVLAAAFLLARPWLDLYRLEHASGTADADRALAHGDRRLVGVSMFSISFPGIESTMTDSAAYQCAFRLASGFTSDAISSDVIRRINGAAMRYARDYNRRLL